MRLSEARIEIINKLLAQGARAWSIYSLHKEVDLTYPAVFNFVKDLEKAGYLEKNNGRYSVSMKKDVGDLLEAHSLLNI